MLDLDIVEVDGRAVDFRENPFETMFFENTNPTSVTTRRIKVKNLSPLTVSFHWSIYKNKNATKISLSDENTHFKIEPSQGKITGGQIIEFEV